MSPGDEPTGDLVKLPTRLERLIESLETFKGREVTGFFIILRVKDGEETHHHDCFDWPGSHELSGVLLEKAVRYVLACTRVSDVQKGDGA